MFLAWFIKCGKSNLPEAMELGCFPYEPKQNRDDLFAPLTSSLDHTWR
jgi:hypothetical protein